jgi:hypothetical protein
MVRGMISGACGALLASIVIQATGILERGWLTVIGASLVIGILVGTTLLVFTKIWRACQRH